MSFRALKFKNDLELPQIIGYINKFDKSTITMSLMVKDKNCLKITIKYRKNRKINYRRRF